MKDEILILKDKDLKTKYGRSFFTSTLILKPLSFIFITFLYMSFLAYVSLRNPMLVIEENEEIGKLLNNLAHIPAYGILAFLLLKCFKDLNVKAKVYTLVISLGYGILMELLQSLNPNRLCSLGDIIRDLVGIGFVILFSRQLVGKV